MVVSASPRSTRQERPVLRCALLAVTASGWFTDLLFAAPQLKLFALPEGSVRPVEDLNPYRLPPVEKPDAILICMNWYKWLETHGEAVVDQVFSRLRSIGDALVGLEGFDLFSLRMPPAGLDRLDILLKAQGVYHDRELYNYEVGAYYPGVNWTRKLQRAKHQYSTAQLEKIRLSLPCFVGADSGVRMRVRKIKSGINAFQRTARRLGDWVTRLETTVLDRLIIEPKATAHCFGTLTHIQRFELLMTLKELGVSGLCGASQVPEYIFGTSYFEEPIPEAERDSIREALTLRGLQHAPMNRRQFKRTMLGHKVVIAPTGYGEITFRHAEAWEQGRALICQDLSHVETMYPFKNKENVLYCRPDFSDLQYLLNAVETGEIDHKRVGIQGRRDWRAWINELDIVFERGVVNPVEAARRMGESARTLMCKEQT